MSSRTYWIGGRFVVEWTLVDTTGQPVSGATVTGTVSTPGQLSTAMTIDAAANVYTASYVVAEAGEHTFRLAASGAAVETLEGSFYVHTSLVGRPPITVNPATDIGQVRVLITDLDEAAPLFTDEQIAGFLQLEGGSLRRGAALALETIATSEALVGKKITTDRLSTDGPAVAKSLFDRAALLRAQAQAADDEAAALAGCGFHVVDFEPYRGVRW